MEGAFLNAVPVILVHNLHKRKIPRKYIRFVAGMLEGRTTHLKFDDYTSDPINIDNRIGQGDPLSMVLYQYYNADILNIPTQPEESAIAYVDDALIMALAENFTKTHEILASMMTRGGGVNEWSTIHNSPLELSKLALIDFAHRAARRECPALVLPNITVKPSESTKYLGIMVDQHLDWKIHHNYAIEKGSKWAAQIRQATRPSWGIMPKYVRCLYIGVALPRILYGMDVWCSVPQGNRSQTPERGMSKVIRKLTSIQRFGTIAITGALRTSPTDTLNAYAFLPPISYMLEKWCQRAAIRLATIPPKHPLYAPVKASSKRYVKKHRSPLHIIFKGFKHDTGRVEKIPTRPRNPAKRGKLPFTVSIPDSKEASVEEARTAKEVIKVYSDGSAIDGKVGATAVLTRMGTTQRILHYHLGPKGEHTVHKAELIGILLAIQLIKTEHSVSVPIAIGADNQAALEAFNTDLRSPVHNIAREIIRQATFLQNRPGRRRHSLVLRWTAGHEGILGNEKADEEAKCAAGGLTSDKSSLPLFLRHSLTINPSAIKQNHNEESNTRWKNEWRKTDRGQAILKMDNRTPSAQLLRSISITDISRRSASLITQMHITHVPLNKFLARINKVDTAQCPACGASSETIAHFLLECPGYAHERWTLEARLTKKGRAMTVEDILGNMDTMIPLVNFIEASHRFTYTAY